MSPLLLAGIVAGLGLVLTAVLTPAVWGTAIAGGMVRQVQADRWHSRPTPAVGGVAIFAGFGLALGAGRAEGPPPEAAPGPAPPGGMTPLVPPLRRF